MVVTEAAVEDLERCRQFLRIRDEAAAGRAGQTIARRLARLRTMPDIGRPFSAQSGFRELRIPFGKSGYVAPYRHEPFEDAVYVVALRHQREAGY